MSTSAHHRAKPTKQQSDTHLLRAVHSTRSLADQTFGQQKTHLNEHPKSSSSSGHPRSERTRGELRNEEEPPSHQSPHYSHSSKMTSQQPQGALDALVHTNDSSPDVSDRRSAPVLRRHRTSPASTVAVHAAQARSRRLLLKQRYINTSLPPPATATHASSLYNAGAAPPSTSSFASASPLPHASGGVAASCTFPTTAFDPSQRHNDGGSSSRTQQHDHMPSWLFENARAFSSPTLLSQAQPTAMSSTSQGSSAPHTQRPPHQHHTQPHSLQSAPAASALKRELSPSPHTTHSSRGGSTQSRAHRTSRRSPSPSASPDSPPSLSHLARHLSAGSLTVPKHAQPLSSSSSQTRNPAQEQPPSFSAAQIHPGSAASRSPASIHRGGLRTAPATAPASSPSSSSSSQRQRHATDSATALSPSASRKARALRAASTVPFLQTKSASSTTHERASKMAAATRATLRDSGRSASHGANLVGSAVAALSSPGAPIAQRTSVSNADTNHRSHPSTESATAAAAARLSNAAAASPSQHPQRPRARTHAAALTDDRTPPSQTADDPLPVHPRHRAQTHASAATLLQSAHRPPLVSFASEPRIAHVRFDGRRGRSDAESDDDDEALGEEGEDEEEVQGEDEEDNDEELEQEEELELKQQQQQNTGQRRAHSKEQAHRKSSAAADHERSRAEDRSLGDARSRSARLRSSKSKSAVALHTSLTLTDHTGTETANHELARGCVQVATDARRRSSSTLPSVERCDAGFQEEDQHSPEGARSAHNAAGRHGNVHDTATRKRRVLGSLLGSKTVSLTSLSQALDRLTDATSSEDESFPFSFHEHEPWEDQIAYTSALLTDARSSGYRPRSAKKSRWVDTIFGGDSTNESSATSQTHRSPPRAGRLIATDAELEQEPHEPASHQSLPHKPQHSQPPSHETRSPRQPHGSSSTQQQQQQQQQSPSIQADAHSSGSLAQPDGQRQRRHSPQHQSRRPPAHSPTQQTRSRTPGHLMHAAATEPNTSDASDTGSSGWHWKDTGSLSDALRSLGVNHAGSDDASPPHLSERALRAHDRLHAIERALTGEDRSSNGSFSLYYHSPSDRSVGSHDPLLHETSRQGSHPAGQDSDDDPRIPETLREWYRQPPRSSNSSSNSSASALPWPRERTRASSHATTGYSSAEAASAQERERRPLRPAPLLRVSASADRTPTEPPSRTLSGDHPDPPLPTYRHQEAQSVARSHPYTPSHRLATDASTFYYQQGYHVQHQGASAAPPSAYQTPHYGHMDSSLYQPSPYPAAVYYQHPHPHQAQTQPSLYAGSQPAESLHAGSMQAGSLSQDALRSHGFAPPPNRQPPAYVTAPGPSQPPYAPAPGPSSRGRAHYGSGYQAASPGSAAPPPPGFTASQAHLVYVSPQHAQLHEAALFSAAPSAARVSAATATAHPSPPMHHYRHPPAHRHSPAHSPSYAPPSASASRESASTIEQEQEQGPRLRGKTTRSIHAAPHFNRSSASHHHDQHHYGTTRHASPAPAARATLEAERCGEEPLGSISRLPTGSLTVKTRRSSVSSVSSVSSTNSNGSNGSNGSQNSPGSRRKPRSPKGSDMSEAELVETPQNKAMFKAFHRQFKQTEKEGLDRALAFARESMLSLPAEIHYRVYLEMADLAKREHEYQLAARHYDHVHQLEPRAAQGWLDHAKLEEEGGDLDRCGRLLTTGLTYCRFNEALLIKTLKHYENTGELTRARALLARLRSVPVERAWRPILEGALLEARAGNDQIARKVFKYLIKHVPWYGPVFQEAFRFECRCEQYQRAMDVVEEGLAQNPRYGPLWFSALRLHEKVAPDGNLNQAREIVQRAIREISRELIWKIYFEAAQMEERAGNARQARRFYVRAVEMCPPNLLWKVWVAGARTELHFGQKDVARSLLKRSLSEVPRKMRSTVLLECARLEEYAGNLERARRILEKARKETAQDWKVFLESILLETRSGHTDEALLQAKEALKVHGGTGRLWALMVHLMQGRGLSAQRRLFKVALHEVPKSGEVWCEGARMALRQGNVGPSMCLSVPKSIQERCRLLSPVLWIITASLMCRSSFVLVLYPLRPPALLATRCS